MFLSKERSRSRIPKPSKPKYLKRSRKPISRKSRFKSNENIFKTYHTKRTPADVIKFAEACRLERLRNPTPAEDACSELLFDMGLKHEREKIHYYNTGTAFIIIDFYGNHHLDIVYTIG